MQDMAFYLAFEEIGYAGVVMPVVPSAATPTILLQRLCMEPMQVFTTLFVKS